MIKEDYIYCEDCNTYVDLFNYGHDIEDAGHKNCKWRFVDENELIVCVEDCKQDGCIE